jgi:nucleoside-diphosphate-sugar epimerase
VVAVTGASGFVGRALTAALLDRKATVRGLSRQAHTDDGMTWIQGDVTDAEAVRRLVDGADVVLHAASYVHRRPRGAADLALVDETNVRGTSTVVDALVAQERRPALVFVSSTAVHGSAPTPWSEDSPCRPETPYGRSKLAAEQIVLRYPVGVVARPSAILGDGAPGSLASLDRLIRLGWVPVIDGGSARKSFTHVSTVVAACLALAERAASGRIQDRVVLVTDDEPCSVADLVRWRAAALDRPARLLSLPRASVDRLARVADAVGLGVVSSLLGTLGGEAVALNGRMRALGVTPTPTAAAWLAGASA